MQKPYAKRQPVPAGPRGQKLMFHAEHRQGFSGNFWGTPFLKKSFPRALPRAVLLTACWLSKTGCPMRVKNSSRKILLPRQSLFRIFEAGLKGNSFNNADQSGCKRQCSMRNILQGINRKVPCGTSRKRRKCSTRNQSAKSNGLEETMFHAEHCQARHGLGDIFLKKILLAKTGS